MVHEIRLFRLVLEWGGAAILCLLFWFPSGWPPSQAQEAQTKVLRNQDVVSLSKAGLSDAAIIALIRKSKTDFDLTPEGLVALRAAGVHNEVIEAMVGLPPTAAGAAAPPQPTKSPTIGIPLPTAYGYYLVQQEKLVQIEPVAVSTVIGIAPAAGGAGWAVDGVRGRPSFKVADRTPTFVIYQQNVNVQSAFYGSAVLVKSMRAGESDAARTNPEFFPAIYRRNYNDLIPVNLWRPQPEMSRFIVEPVVERPGMFRLRTLAGC